MYKKFRELLMNVAANPMREQQRLLRMELENWRRKYTQTDDITVMGIKFLNVVNGSN